MDVDIEGKLLNAADAPRPFQNCPTGQICPVLGAPVLRNIAKIEVGNNVANFQDTNPSRGLEPDQLRSLLVPATNDPAANTITIGTATISGLGGSAPLADTTGAGRLSLSGFTNPVLIPMRQTVVATTASPDSLSSTRGIGLKVLSFEVSADHSTVIWGPKDSIRFVGTNAGEAFFEDSIPVQPIEPPLNGTFQVRFQDKLERIVVNGGSSSVQTIEGVVAVFTLEKLTGKDSELRENHRPEGSRRCGTPDRRPKRAAGEPWGDQSH